MKITVIPEGREGIWLPDRDSLKAWISAQGFDDVHNMVDIGPVLVGADHSVDSLLTAIDEAERIAIMTGESFRGNRSHALAVISPPGDGLPERLQAYDVGEIALADLDVVDRLPEASRA